MERLLIELRRLELDVDGVLRRFTEPLRVTTLGTCVKGKLGCVRFNVAELEREFVVGLWRTSGPLGFCGFALEPEAVLELF